MNSNHLIEQFGRRLRKKYVAKSQVMGVGRKRRPSRTRVRSMEQLEPRRLLAAELTALAMRGPSASIAQTIPSHAQPSNVNFDGDLFTHKGSGALGNSGSADSPWAVAGAEQASRIGDAALRLISQPIAVVPSDATWSDSFGDTSSASTLVIIDPALPDYQSLMDQITSVRDADVHLLSEDRDGVAQIGELLSTYTNADAVHILSHGTRGELRLGTTRLNGGNLNDYANHLDSWNESLAPGADILLYGCNVSAGRTGFEFIQAFAAVTAADVAASDNLTGSAELGGDWILESVTGTIETDPVLALPYEGVFDSEATISGGTLVVTDTTDSADDFVLEVVGSNYVISNNSPITPSGMTDLDSDPDSVTVAISSVSDVNVDAMGGDDTITARHFGGLSATIDGGGGDDTFVFGPDWGLMSVVDANGGTVDFSSFTGTISAKEAAGNVVVLGQGGSQVVFDAAGSFVGTPEVLDSTAAQSSLTDGLDEIAALGKELETFDRMDSQIELLGEQSIGDFLPIGDILEEGLAQPVADYFASLGSAKPELAGIVQAFNRLDGGGYSGTGNLNFSVDATGMLDGDVVTVELSVVAETTHTLELDLGERVLGLDGALEELLATSPVTADLTTQFAWDFTVGVDTSATPYFFGEFADDIAVTADVHVNNAAFELNAGLLELGVGAFGPGLAPSTIQLDADVTLDSSSLASLDGTGGGASDGVIRLIELQNPARLNSFAADPSATARVDLELYASATDVTGITDVTKASIQFSDDLFDAVPATFSENLVSLGVAQFYNLNASGVLQVMQQFGSYLDLLSLKSLDNERVLVGQSATIGDLIDVDGLFQDEFLRKIELPRHTAAATLVDIIGGLESGETLSSKLGTSNDTDPEFTVTLRDGTAFDVDVDGVTTLGGVTSRIQSASPGTAKFEVVVNSDGSMTLVDKTASASQSHKFKITAQQDGSAKDYAAAANLGLTAVATEQDAAGGGKVFAIEVAPNPGPNFSTLRQMLSLPTDGGSLLTTTGPMAFDSATSKLGFTIDISKTFPSSSDALALPDLGALGDLVSVSTVDLLDPTVTLHFPFELDFNNVGFSTPLSDTTPLSDLNLGSGVSSIEDAEDLRVHLSDGSTFTVNFDAGLAEITLASLGGGSGVATSGDAAAELNVTLNDGLAFDVDFDADVDSTDAPPATLGEVVEAIQAAADAAASIEGTIAGGAANQIVDSAAPFGAVDSLVGRLVTVGDETLTVTSNTADTLTLGIDWTTPPSVGDSYLVRSHVGGLASLDTARGTLSLIDRTTAVGGHSFSVAGSASVPLGIDGAAQQRNTNGSVVSVIESSLVTLGHLIAKIETAASGAGLVLPSSSSFSDPYNFDVQIVDSGIVLVDRTPNAAAITGVAEIGSGPDELVDTGSFSAFDPNALVGRIVQIVGGAGAGQSLAIIANSADTLTLEADWETPIDATSTYEIANGLIVAALNDSGARVGLGLATTAIEQATNQDAALFDGSHGLAVRTTGTPAPDLNVTLSGGGPSFSVDLDGAAAPLTVRDFADRIAAAAVSAGVTTSQFSVLTDSGTGVISLIDRVEAGTVGTFTVTNAPGSFAATDLGLSTGSLINVDFNSPVGSELDPEFVIELKSPTQVLGGSPQHGDTVAAHLGLATSVTPTIQFDLGLEASGGTGSGLYGPLSVEFSDLTIDRTGSQLAASLTIDSATVGQLWGGLGSPFTWLAGDQVNFSNTLDLDLKLKPLPSISGVGGALRTDFEVDIANLYDVRDGVESIDPDLTGMDDVKSLLVAVEQLTIPDLFEYLDAVAEYLFTLQTQSTLADRLPGLSKSIGELFGFGTAFKERVEELRELPDELRADSIQELSAQLSAPLSGAALIVALSFDPLGQELAFDLDFDLDAITALVPITLDLTKLGLDREALGLQKVAAIVDTLKSSPLDVTADGSIDVRLAVDLSDPSSPSPFLSGTTGPGSGTEANFDVRAINDDTLSFTTLLGSLPAEVLGGAAVLDIDGDGASVAPANYTVDLVADAGVATAAQITGAASAASTTVQIAGQMDATFELAFPQQVIPTDAPSTTPIMTVGVSDLNDPSVGTSLTTNLVGGVGNWPTFEVLTRNFSLADSMEGFKLGFYDLFTKLDDALDTALLGHNLPLVGNQLAEAADFLLQMRDSVVDNLNLYGKSISVDSVRQGIFDAFGPGGFGWLQNDPSSGDSVVNVDDVQVITQAITIGGRELVVGVEYQMELVTPPQLLQSPVDLDLLLPGLGLNVDALADVMFGFHLPLSVGVSIADGVYIDVDRANDLEISLDVALPSAAISMSGDPRLTFTNPLAASPVVTRDRGNWILDGFRVGQIIRVSGSSENDGNYVIKSIDATGLDLTLRSTNANLDPVALDQDRVVPEGPTSGITIGVHQVSQTGGPSLTFTNVIRDITPNFPEFANLPAGTFTVDLRDEISRSSGSWLEDGFVLGDSITITGTGSNNNVFQILAISPDGRRITVDKVLTNETTSGAFVRRAETHGLSARMGVLPFRIQDGTPNQSEMTGTFVIDLLDPAVVGGNQRLALNDLIAEAPYPRIPPSGFSTAPLPNVLSITEKAGDEFTVNPISLILETDLPPGAAFPPYRMQLDVTNWDWEVNGSLAQEINTPTIAFNDVQFELVGFVRDFLGAAITRTSVALDAVDPLLVFLQSEAMPIVSLLFGRTSYASAPGTFGGQTQVGDFTGAATALRALANGGRPFERDAIGEFFSDLFENREFDDLNLLPIMQLTGEAWIDLGRFSVNGAVARGQSGDLFDSGSNSERELGKFDDAPLRLTGTPQLAFAGSTITLPASHSQTWPSAGFQAGQTIRVSSGANAGLYSVSTVTDAVLTITGVFPTTETVTRTERLDIAAQHADGGWGGSIHGQIAAIARDPSSSARSAAQSYVTTQLLPGNKKVEGIGGVANKLLNNDFFEQGTGRTVESIKLPILQRSFDLLLGETSFEGRGEENSYLMSYSTPELALVLYHLQPLDWEGMIGTLVNRVVAKVVGRPLDSYKYAVPFVSISFEARADYAMAFDTTGLQRFGVTGNADDIADGFYFDDFEGVEPNPSAIGNVNVGAGSQSGAATGLGTSAASTRMDEAQVRILGGVGLGVFVDPFLVIAGGALKDFIQARLGFELALFLGQDQNFHDPNGDGRIRAGEFDVLTGFSQDFSAGTYAGDGKEAFDDGLRIELRGDVFASVKVGIFLTHSAKDFPLLPIGFKLIDIRVNIFTIGITIPVDTPGFSPPDLGSVSGGVLALVFQSGDNILFVGASSAPDDSGRQNIIVSGHGFHEQFTNIRGITGVAGPGNDSVFVMHNVLVTVHLNGGGGHDTLVGGSANDTLIGGSGNDHLNGRLGNDHLQGDSGADMLFGDDGNDRMLGGTGRDVIRGWRDDDDIDGGDDDDLIDGGTGADTINGGSGFDIVLGGIGRDTLRGGAQRDRIEGGRGADHIDGGDGDDLLFGGLGNDTIAGSAGADQIWGERHNDSLEGGTENDTLDGGEGSDRVQGGEDDDLIKSRAGDDILNGQQGDDTYHVLFASGKANSLVRIVESGPAQDTDVFVAFGTLQSDQFLLRASVSGSNAFVAMLSDPDHASTDPAYDPAVQRINYLGVERIVVNGGLGDDRFAVDDTAAEITLNGEGGEDTFQIGQLFRSERTEVDANVSVDDVFATIETTRGFLSNGISRPMTINGGLGNDRFVVFHNKAVLSLNGDAGDDDFEVRAFALVGSREPERARTDITGGAGADLVQYAVNAPVNINGGDGFDTLTVIGTEFGDDFVITKNGVFGAGLTIDFTNIESLRVDGAEGNDRFFVQSTGVTFLTELFGGLGEDTFNMSGETPPVVSNDLLGHSGIISNDVTFSNDLRYEDLTLFGVSANVADNDEPFVVIRSSGGSTIVSETSSADASLIDYYEVVLSRAPMLGFDVLVKALAPIPSPDRRELGALAFRLSSPAPGSDEKADGSSVTLRFTAENWTIPQRVEIRADGEPQTDTGLLFTRPELSESVAFDYNDDALEGRQSAVVNHIVISSAATVEGKPIAVNDSPTITIATNRPFYEFLGEDIRVTLADGVTVQNRRIIDARLVEGDMQLTVDRSWLASTQVPDATSTFSIDLDGTPLTGSPLSASNTTFSISDPLDPVNPFLDEVDDLLGRQVTIVDGLGTGQSRFITGADSVVALSGSSTGVFTPGSKSFSFDLTEATESVDVLTGATLNVVAKGDFDYFSETLTVNVDGTDLAVLFGGSEGRVYSPMRASIPLSQSQLQTALADGRLDLQFTPSPHVNNFDWWYGASRLSFDLQFTVDATSATFNKGVLGDMRLTLDRGWQAGDAPDGDSRFQIRIDDAQIGKVTAINETPTGLPVDPSFPAELDTRTTFSDSTATFDAASFGPEGLRGATIEIVGGPGAGQQRLVLGTVNRTTLILNGDWRTDPVPGESLYRIARYDGLAVSSVGVEINDNDEAGLIVDETKGLDGSGMVVDDFDTVTAVIEGGDGDQLGEHDVVRVRLSRQPTANVTVSLQFDGVQLDLRQLDGSGIPGNSLDFSTTTWDTFQDVVVVASHDLIREGFHTSLIELVTSSTDTDLLLAATDDFVIPINEPVEFVGLSHQPVSITSVRYNGQTLSAYDPHAPAGTPNRPVWQLVSNKVVFRAGDAVTTVLGSDLHVSYSYLNPGFDQTFTQPVLARISDADAPTVLVRETEGSTDVVEGAASFLTVEFSGASFVENSLLERVVTVDGGTGAGQSAKIIGNTENTITLDQTWAVLPDPTSTLTISNDVVGGITVPGSVTGDVAFPYERDAHTVFLVAGATYTFDLEGSITGKGSLHDPYLWIYDSNGRLVALDDDGGAGLNSHINFTPNFSGTYVLSAGGYASRTGTYTLSTNFSSDIPAGTATPAQLFTPGSAVSSIGFTGDQDWYAVMLSVGNSYTFDLEGASTSMGTLDDPVLRLLDASGAEIVRHDDIDGATNRNARITFDPTDSGLHYLSAEALGSGVGTYRLSGTTTPAVLTTVSTTVKSFEKDTYELVLTARPDDGTGSGTGLVEVTVTPEITKTTRTGGVRTDAQQVEIYNIDALPASRVKVDPGNSDNLIVSFDQSNWDQPIRIGVRAIDDSKVDGGDTKVFANGPNTLSEILGPVVVDGAGGDGSLVGIGPPEKLPHETNVKQKTGEVDAVDGFDVTLAPLSLDELAKLGLNADLSDVSELIGKTIEVVATHPTTDWLAIFPAAQIGSYNDPVVGQFRLITAAAVVAGKIVVSVNERFGIGGDAIANITSGTTSAVEVTLSREQRLKLGIGNASDLLGRHLELTDASGAIIGQGEITDGIEHAGVTTITVAADFASLAADAVGFFIRSDDLIKSYAITSESLNFFVDEAQSVDYMFIHDEDSPADSTGFLTAERLWGLNMGPDITIGARMRAGGISYGNLEVLQIDLGSGNNDFHVLGTHTRVDDPATVNDETYQTWTILNTGNDVYWPITDRQGDIVNVSLNDTDLPVVVGGSVAAGADPSQTEFAKIVDSASPFGAADSLVGYRVTTTNAVGTVQVRTILGNTADTIFVDGVWSEIPVAGDSYEITNRADGAFAVNTQAGDDTVDASGSTLEIVVVGGLGNDTITGGSSDDILFGDQGRVDYFGMADGDGNLPIVTRIGDAALPISGSATGDFSNHSHIRDANAVFPVADGFDIGLQGLYVDINNGTGFLQTPRLITGNTGTELDVAPDFTETLDATSSYRISTYPEDQTDGVVREANLIVTVNDLQGGNDVISGGASDDQIFGGAGDDDLTGDEGADIVFGDTGVVDRTPMAPSPTGTFVRSLVDLVRTKTPDSGGSDMISGDDDDDIILGGFGTDYVNFDRAENQLPGESGNDLIIGDNGFADFDLSTGRAVLVRIETNEPANGSQDFITAGDGKKIIFGGAGGDALLAGSDAFADLVVGDEGFAVFDPVTGIRSLVETTTPTEGGRDVITAGNASNVLIGGADDDSITGGNARDVILGDNGRAVFDAAGELIYLVTTDTAIGGDDLIQSHGGNDVVLGGAADDTIRGGAGRDNLLGDNGRIDYTLDGDLTTLDQIITIDPNIGGDDLIEGEADNDILIGGTADDQLSGGDAHDILLGDHGEVDFRRPVDDRVISRFITSTDGGGNDIIDGNDGDDFAFGGQGNDTIRGGVGQDDMVGGHNVPFGSDADDTIEGNENEDAILGDNGIITRTLLSTQLGTWQNYLAPFDSVVIRDVQAFDDQDLVAGNDSIDGGDAMDIIDGQRGNDNIDGGADDDEIEGGLGDDTIQGGGGRDVVMADSGEIFRDFNADGTPRLNANGQWHRDVMLEDIGRVVGKIDLDRTPLTNLPPDLAAQILEADMVVLGGSFQANGDRLNHTDNRAWNTTALLIDLVSSNDDTIDGGEDDDTIFGQRGDDSLAGGNGDDTLFGDGGTNLVSFETDLPQIVGALRLIEAAGGVPLDLDPNGSVIVTNLVAKPGDLMADRPDLQLVSGVNTALEETANHDALRRTDGSTMVPLISLIPDFIHHTSALAGNDDIAGDDGKDLIFGDHATVRSELRTGVEALQVAMDEAIGDMLGVMHALNALSMDHDVVGHQIDAVPIGQPRLEIGNDRIDGGLGEDTIVGDEATIAAPSAHGIPIDNPDFNLAALAFQSYLTDLQHVIVDFAHVVQLSHHQVTETLLADARVSNPLMKVLEPNEIVYLNNHELVKGNDTIAGGASADTIVADDALLLAPIITGGVADLPSTVVIPGIDQAALESLEKALIDQRALAVAAIFQHVANDHADFRSLVKDQKQLDRIAYVNELNRELGNDKVEGNEGDDLVIGDFGGIVMPLVATVPPDDKAVSELDQHITDVLDEIAAALAEDHFQNYELSVGELHFGKYFLDDHHYDARHSGTKATWEIGNDEIDGGDGEDILLADHVSFVQPILTPDPTNQVHLRQSELNIRPLESNLQKLLRDPSFSGITSTVASDVVTGGDGNDTLLGSFGDDDLNGGDGDDDVFGGNGVDTLDGGIGNNDVRKDGGDLPRKSLYEKMQNRLFANHPPQIRQMLADAAAGGDKPVSGDVIETGGASTGGSTVTPTLTVNVLGPPVGVRGELMTFASTVSGIVPGSAHVTAWQITDGSGTVVFTGDGDSIDWAPETNGPFTVRSTVTDESGNVGVTAFVTQVEESRLLETAPGSGRFNLIISGTSGEDDIELRRGSAVDSVVMKLSHRDLNSATITQEFFDVDLIIVFAGDGDDDIIVDRRLAIPTRLYGQAGDDKLRGGAATDLLDGGAGDDRIDGSSGRDLLIGGFGQDRLDGEDDQDLLIGNIFTPSSGGSTADAVLAEWTRTDLDYDARVSSLLADISASLLDDGVRDDLRGGKDHDWFFASNNDKTDTKGGETSS